MVACCVHAKLWMRDVWCIVTPEPFSFNNTTAIMGVSNLIVSLYIWELIYRVEIGFPLLVHHVCTVLMAQLALACVQVGRNRTAHTCIHVPLHADASSVCCVTGGRVLREAHKPHLKV